MTSQLTGQIEVKFWNANLLQQSSKFTDKNQVKVWNTDSLIITIFTRFTNILISVSGTI